MKYCIDTSALIDLGERYYPERLAVFAPLWEDIYELIDTDVIVSSESVKIELEKKADDWRTNFNVQTNGIFLIDSGIEQEFGEFIQEMEASSKLNLNKHRERFMMGADPWCVAVARSLGDCKVVSGEKKSLAHYGLGEVCKEFGVEHIPLLDFFEENNIGVK